MQFFQDEHFSWKILLIESFVIMMSVVLGFYLTGWRQDISQEKKEEKAINAIALEIIYNHSRMEKLIPVYENFADTLEVLIEKRGRGATVNTKKLHGNAGLDFPTLKGAAFKTAQVNGILSYMDYEIVKELYAAKTFEKNITSVTDKFVSAIINGKLETLGDWHMFYNTMMLNCNRLNEGYLKLLPILKKEYGENLKITKNTKINEKDNHKEKKEY